MNTLHREITASGPGERSGEQNCEVDGSLCGSGIVPRVLLFEGPRGLEASIFSLSVSSFPRLRTTQVVASFLQHGRYVPAISAADSYGNTGVFLLVFEKLAWLIRRDLGRPTCLSCPRFRIPSSRTAFPHRSRTLQRFCLPRSPWGGT